MPYSELFHIEMRGMNSLTRSQLMHAIHELADGLPADLQERGEDESIERLRLVLYAARLIEALRQMPRNQRLGALFDK